MSNYHVEKITIRETARLAAGIQPAGILMSKLQYLSWRVSRDY